MIGLLLVSLGGALQGYDMALLCILTPDPAYPEDWQSRAAKFSQLFGDQVDFRCWHDAGDLSGFGLTLPLLAWGYNYAPDLWYDALDAWEAQGVRFANPIPLLRWNTNKAYLLGLAKKGLAIVPTRQSDRLVDEDVAAARAAFGTDNLVIKPAISAGADGTFILGPTDAIPFDVLERTMLIQPLMRAIQNEGEFSLFYFGGALSHAILKTPASGDFRVQEQFGGREVTIDAPAPAQRLAEAVLAAAPMPPLYARVDMVRDAEGAFRLMELEAIEPALFLDFAPDKGAAFAKAVLNQLAA